MPTPYSIKMIANRVENSKTECGSIKSSLLRSIGDAKSYWMSESANVFYDECSEIFAAFDQNNNKLASIKERIDSLANEVQRADQERAAKLEAERRAAERAAEALKNKNKVTKVNF